MPTPPQNPGGPPGHPGDPPSRASPGRASRPGFPSTTPPDLRTVELVPGIVLDVRRAVWLAFERTLLVADLHLGYPWVERRRGTLLPLIPDDTLERLLALATDYRPGRWVFLGDIVHGDPKSPKVEDLVRTLVETLGASASLELVLGNHDARLPDLLRRTGLREIPCRHLATAGPHVLVHGDRSTWTELHPLRGETGWVFYGHEHPALRLDDGVATSVKAPCFLVGSRCVVLPAFSSWAAGSVWGCDPQLSPLADGAALQRAWVILGERLLPLPLQERRKPTSGGRTSAHRTRIPSPKDGGSFGVATRARRTPPRPASS